VNGDLIPVSDNQAKAIETVASLVGKVIDSASAAAKAPVVQALIGLAGGNHLIAWNERQCKRLKARTEEILIEDGVKQVEALSPSLAIPLVAAAENETRPELEELWARLLATGMNPQRAREIRVDFIETLKQFDPLDAALLITLSGRPTVGGSEESMGLFRRMISEDQDDLIISIRKLERLGCFFIPQTINNVVTTPYGRKLVAACSKK